MKTKLFKFALPIGMGLILISITIMGLISISFVGCFTPNCPAGDLAGTDGSCYKCSSGSTATYSPSGNCSNAIAGVYCCTGSGGGGGGGGTTAYCNPGNTYNYSSGKCCPNSAPYYYPGTHGITGAGCYKSCPYVNDCGNKFTKY